MPIPSDSIASAAALLVRHLQSKKARGQHSIRLRPDVRQKLAFPMRIPGQPTPELSPDEKASALSELADRLRADPAPRKLGTLRETMVFATGNPDASLMFVGEAPGAEEERQGEPFVGRAGELFNRIIQAMNLKRDSLYITNALKFRPAMPGQNTNNRKPSEEELATCRPYLLREVEIVRPNVIVALGVSARQGLTAEQNVTIKSSRGIFSEVEGIPLLTTYHPSYFLRPENDSPEEKRKIWEDMLMVMEKTGLPISEKQREFFRR